MNCLHCGEETKNPKYCSRSCSAKQNGILFPKRKTKKKCIVCGNPVKSYRHNRCNEHWDIYKSTKFDYIKELTLKEYWNRDSLKNLHPSSKNAHIRGLARSNFKNLISKPCAKCGYSKHVELCHIKPISSFSENDKIKDVNSYNNLIQLCPNCHWEFDNGIIQLS